MLLLLSSLKILCMKKYKTRITAIITIFYYGHNVIYFDKIVNLLRDSIITEILTQSLKIIKVIYIYWDRRSWKKTSNIVVVYYLTNNKYKYNQLEELFRITRSNHKHSQSYIYIGVRFLYTFLQRLGERYCR